ncbi:MAG: GMC family oxidoreductase N-terminal domain-containing protein [Deltaproteobacteria bacterium]|nr:GMC family oxidoreductase N-terminal domain-containing protein [Deltaproteobacteria bacterium]
MTAMRVYAGLLGALDAAALVATRRRCVSLSAAEREALLDRWSRAGLVRRSLVAAVTTPLKYAHFDDPGVYALYGAQYDKSAPAEPPQPWMRQVTSGADVAANETIECDVVVVGTGAGGAVVAKELAEKGLAVAILEEGRYLNRGDFARGSILEMQAKLYRHGGLTFTLGNGVIQVPAGRLVGGSTAVNTATCWRTPEWILDHWVKDLALTDLSAERMAPHFDAVWNELGVSFSSREAIGPQGDIVARGCDALGYAHQPVWRNARDCDGQGVCDWGCPTDAKRSMNLSYIPSALKSHASLFTESRADRVWMEDGKAVGLEVVATATKARFGIRARATILAGGALPTPVLLQRQGIANTSGQVGRNLSVHPATAISALMGERVDPFAHVPQGYAVTQFVREGILILGALAPIDAAAAYFLSQGRSYTELMDAYANVASLGVMVEDHARGRVTPGPNGFPVIRYMMSKKDARQLQRGLVEAGKVYLAAGASRLMPAVLGHPMLEGKKGLDAFAAADIGVHRFLMIGFHPLGTCRMGVDPRTSVVDP